MNPETSGVYMSVPTQVTPARNGHLGNSARFASSVIELNVSPSAGIIEAYSRRDNTTLNGVDRRLSLLGEHSSPYSGNLDVVPVQFPPGYRLYPYANSQGETYEAVFTVAGAIVDKSLPPFEVIDKKQLNNPCSILQTITLTGAGSPSFEKAVAGLDEVYRACERSFPERKLKTTDCSSKSGKVIFASTRYFTSTHEAGEMQHIPFIHREDPKGILTAIASEEEDLYRRTVDNQILFGVLRNNSEGRPTLYPFNPLRLRASDVVEIAVSFTILPVKHGEYRLLTILRAVILLEEGQSKAPILRVPRWVPRGPSRQRGRTRGTISRHRPPYYVSVARHHRSSFPSQRGPNPNSTPPNTDTPFDAIDRASSSKEAAWFSENTHPDQMITDPAYPPVYSPPNLPAGSYYANPTAEYGGSTTIWEQSSSGAQAAESGRRCDQELVPSYDTQGTDVNWSPDWQSTGSFSDPGSSVAIVPPTERMAALTIEDVPSSYSSKIAIEPAFGHT